MNERTGEHQAGILLHPTSLPSGRLDGDVERWLDCLCRAGARVWQMLPPGIPDTTGSPYQSCSAFAANPALLAPDPTLPLAELTREDFVARERDWLIDFARFRVLKQRHDQRPWQDWAAPLRDREPAALARLDQEAQAEIDREIDCQHLPQRRWLAIRAECARRGLHLFGDLPLFVALDSAEVWAARELFLLDEHGQPIYVAGVPPDYFSEIGQRWGNPHYDWQAMQADGFRWWRRRLRRTLDWFDLVRLDHFRGLVASWMIPADSATAAEGFWQPVPGAALLEALHGEFPELPLVAEDLGIITPEVLTLRQRFELPGMAVLQFAFDGHEDNPHKPANIGPDTVVYTGTHDNDTVHGWFAAQDPATREFVYHLLGGQAEDDVADLLIQAALASRAWLAVLPLQDLLRMGSEARMNTPGTTEGNWRWRVTWEQIDPARLDWLRGRLRETGRDHEC
ncbi:4-alpha-glucanotransferase [endosymbiont of unidentified scaly snail isolate Monju]|uniref:4-alpha-glucanotransferase n=1 Tax=endosymbiont of unidentified scaly snail isolate Monju TaxID=1248727 RepID=UPI0003891CFF|nr:4-alpha-glucanotransferase [endosymbiont of unidentified scaly snail isolate Monju]BAN70084.1 4-alpha-glucanotransferase [endosymbiont of unidentified scaly snail isolate Monju]